MHPAPILGAGTRLNPQKVMIKLQILGLAASLVLAAGVASQACSKLTATGSSTGVSLELTGGTPNAVTFLAFGEQAGTTKFDFGPLGTLELGLASPLMVLPIGRTDAKGDLSLKVDFPKPVPAFEVKAQADNAKLDVSGGPLTTLTLKFCTSNVADVKGGGS